MTWRHLVLPLLLASIPVSAWAQEAEFADEDDGPSVVGFVGENSDRQKPAAPQESTSGSSGPYSYTELRPKDFFLDQPCGPDHAMAAVDVWLITGPPHRETFQYHTITCVPVPWWLDPNPPVAVPNLNQVSAQAIIREHLPLPDVTVSPDTHGIAGLEVWLWHEPAPNLEPIDHDNDPSTPPKPGLTVTDREGPYSITATVWIDRYAWDMGDETIVTSEYPGDEERPAATHTYRTASPDYTITAHTVWAGRYSWTSPNGSGTDVDMGELDVASAPRPYPVHEVHAVPADS